MKPSSLTSEDINSTVYWFPDSIVSKPLSGSPRSGRLDGIFNSITAGGGNVQTVSAGGYTLNANQIHRTAEEAKRARGLELAKLVNSLREHASKLLTADLPEVLIINDDAGNLVTGVDVSTFAETRKAA